MGHPKGDPKAVEGGTKGGNATSAKYGVDHYKEIGRRGGETKRDNRKGERTTKVNQDKPV